MQPFKIVLLSMSAVFLFSCSQKKEEPVIKDQEVIPVKVIALDPSATDADIVASGRFTTDDEVSLSFKTAGVINRIFVKEGDPIHPGQLLATLHLNEVNAQVGQIQAGYEKAQRDLQRVTNLYRDSVASLEQLQNAKTALELTRQQLSAAQFNRNYSEIRATQNGFVLRKLANEGQVMSIGATVLQTNGAHSGNWMLKVGVSDKDWARIAVNNKADIRSEAAGDKVLTGYVLRRAEGVDPATGSFSVDIKLDSDASGKMASGMFGSAVIHTKATGSTSTLSNTWSIPYDALLDGDGSTGYVFVTRDGSTAEKIKVTIASMEKDRIMISDGLQGAGSLIVSGSAYLTDKSKIKIVK